MTIALTSAAYLVGAVVVYYAVLFVVAFTQRGPDGDDPGLTFVLFVPALNEEAVIAATLQSLLELDHDRCMVCVADDASSDATPEILSRYVDDPRVLLVSRSLPNARTGKSDVLNECFRATMHAITSGHPLLGGADPARVVVGIVDADGRLDRETLVVVAPYFADEQLASVQIGVRIANAGTNLLTRMQDMEFVGFSAFVQRARDRLGSSGLGGNGQFTRLSALVELAAMRDGPWESHALTEDLELGLALICSGWRTRFCPDVYVAQQGLPGWRALFRQRTRWIQGHYACWSYLPKLVRAPASLRSRFDLMLYLVLIVTVIVVTFNAIVSALTLTGVAATHSAFLAFLPQGHWRNTLDLLFGITPLVIFMYAYQRHATKPFRPWEVPAAAVVFTAYTYVWILATMRALFRHVTGRRNWVKTPRVADLVSAEPEAIGAGG